MLRSESQAALKDETEEEEEEELESDEGHRDNVAMLMSELRAALEDEVQQEEQEEQEFEEGLKGHTVLGRSESYEVFEDVVQQEEEEVQETEEMLTEDVAIGASKSYAALEDEVNLEAEEEQELQVEQSNSAATLSESDEAFEDEERPEGGKQKTVEWGTDSVAVQRSELQVVLEEEEEEEQEIESGRKDLTRGTAFADPGLGAGVLKRGGEVYVRRRCGACLLRRSRAKCMVPPATMDTNESNVSFEQELTPEVEVEKIEERKQLPKDKEDKLDCRRRWPLLPFDVLPDWRKDDRFVHQGHRPSLPTVRSCFKSIFRMHTETFNIWTHLMGFLLFLSWGVVYMFKSNRDFVAPLEEKMVIGIFFIGAILCTCFSWIYHTVHCNTRKEALKFSKLDYTGIALLFLGSVVPWIYYTFYCSPVAHRVYLLIFTLLGICSIYLSHQDWFTTTPYRIMRASLFLCLGLGAFIPFFHFKLFSPGPLDEALRGQQSNFLFVAFLYIIGVILYFSRIPERFCPGRCQIWFHSHQMFHVLVVSAAIVHLCAIAQMQEYRFSKGAACR